MRYGESICWNCRYRWSNPNGIDGYCYMFRERHGGLSTGTCGQYEEGKPMVMTGHGIGGEKTHEERRGEQHE